MTKRYFFTIFSFLLLISFSSFSGTSATHLELTPEQSPLQYWTCYAKDSGDRNFPGLEKNKESALKTALEKCSFFSDSSDTCRLSQEDCEFDDL